MADFRIIILGALSVGNIHANIITSRLPPEKLLSESLNANQR